MTRLLTSTIVFIALICSGCATSTTTSKNGVTERNNPNKSAEGARPQPDWVTGESKNYSRLDYITSRTQGASADAAAAQAQSRLSSMFMADLAQYDMSERQAAASGGYEINRTFQPEDGMTAATPEIERILGMIEIVDQWYDSSSNTYHALAALPRNSGLGYLRNQIQMLDANTQGFIKTAKESKDPLTKMGQTALAWRAQQLRSSMQESMRDVDLTRRGIEPQWQLESLRQDINNQLVNLKIYPSGVVDDANAEAIGNALTSALKVADLKPATEKQADYKISATIKSTIIGEKNGWAVGQGTISLVLSDKQNNERGNLQWVIEVSGINEDAALRRVMEKSEFTLKKEMRNSLLDMALGN
ncbi:MAG: hypothetical protein U1B30_05160 [Pseudomonadota bacterium]|nr:hypothetical protein [Pseudomonadota bacterium]